MSVRKPEFLLIWDVDGTLIRARGLGKLSLEKAFSRVYGIENGMSGINLSGMIDTIILKLAWDANNIPPDRRDGNEYFKIYTGVLADEISRVRYPFALPGIKSILHGLEAEGRCFSMLGTGNIEKGARLKLSVDDLNTHFKIGGFAEDAGNSDERWRIIAAAAAKAREYTRTAYKNDNTFVIGDTAKDIECGKIAGFRTIGVATGMYDTSALSEAEPDFLFKDFDDTAAFFRLFEGT